MQTHGLTDLGRTQAAQLAARLAGVQFARFYSSPLLRARQSADILAERLGLEYVDYRGLATAKIRV